MNLNMTGIVELDVHGMNAANAISLINKEISKAANSVYRIRVIHGYNRGTSIKDAIREEYSYGREPKVIRIENGTNMGITELVLREYYK